ncbi:hypothetical protein G6F52_008840 [Rhizopus delemar]|nr:hypothetical protein G6F52_008840 [Rhizopus delemar]
MQSRRKIYVNMKVPEEDIESHYVSNRVRTAKYTPISFIPKNLFEQFRNVANLYFLFLVILQCIPLFGVAEPAVSALPLIAILVITAIKDAIEDWKRNQSDNHVNNSKVLKLANWKNVNIPDIPKGIWYYFHVVLGFLSLLSGSENKYAHQYRQIKINKKAKKIIKEHKTPVIQQSSKSLMKSVRQRSDTIKSELSNIFKPNNSSQTLIQQKKSYYRPGSIPHSVLYRIDSVDTRNNPSTSTDATAVNTQTKWKHVKWKELNVGDYVKLENDQDIPADIVILSTSETDNICYIETQNLDGETNLKQRQGLPGTATLHNEQDCEQARFYIESEPPHVNIYQYNAVLRWQVDVNDTETIRSGVSHEKADAVTHNNLLLRGCVLRNTKWVIGVVVYTGSETKIMLNSGRTPSKRSKITKATNPHVIADFCILAVLCIVSSIMDSVQFNGRGSSRYFDFGIEGSNASYSGFLTFWVTLILYQNLVPISLYVSVEIVKSIGAYFIFADIDMYYEETDTPCIPKTWNILDDLGQIEYIFSDKTGTLTQNVMEYRKCTINGVPYGLGVTEATMGALKREQSQHSQHQYNERGLNMEELTPNDLITDADKMEKLKKDMFSKQAQLFENKYVGPNPTFVDPKLFDDLAQDATKQSMAITHFYQSLALCHTVIAERSDEANPNYIEYKAQSPDEAALVSTARDLGFAFLGRDSNKLSVSIKGEKKIFQLLNTLEFNSTRKRMSVIIKPDDTDRIVLLCKGADSVIYERLCSNFGDQTDLESEQLALRDSTAKDLELFANEGLRTLCLSYRFISSEEYRLWNKKYQEAAASIYQREERIDAVSEEIERDMLLMGGTAIEDRLQVGVPETIAELAKSGIKLWVLTGDKTETAINIGYACNLLTTDMNLLILKADNREETTSLLDKTLKEIAKEVENSEGSSHALVIDGLTLKYALEEKTRRTLLAIGMRCVSVICCRVSPKQKAEVVRLVKKELKVMTLAIGDGANDVSMIQEANVGIGISGVEGRQAVMASDYAIAQFRFNGSMMFDYALVTLFNVVFTSLPIMFMGIWDQDLDAELSLKHPQLYRMGLRDDKFKVWRFWLTIFDSIFQSSVCFFFPYMLLIGGPIDPTGHDANGVYEIAIPGSKFSSLLCPY